MGIEILTNEFKTNSDKKDIILTNVKSKITNIFSDSYEPSALDIGGTIFAGILIGALSIKYGSKALKLLKKDSFNETIYRQAKSNNITDINLELLPSNTIENATRINIGLKRKCLRENIEAVQPKTLKIKDIKIKKAGYNMSKEETELFGSVLDDYERLYPVELQCNSYCDTESIIKRHINGNTSKVTWRLDKYADRTPFPTLSLESSGKRLGVYTKDSEIFGDTQLVKEYKDFLNGNIPNETNFNAFLRHRDLNYAKENGITDIKSLRVSKEKGAEIEEAEKLYHKKRQDMYSSLWREYPTEQFYRVIGKDELVKLLRGQMIISETSKARYGRECVDITTDAYYHNICYGETKFRIPFIRKTPDGKWNTEFTSKIYAFNPRKAHYQVPSYSINDVDIQNIKYWSGSDWVSFDINSVMKALK